ncbi:MAG: hypothetical protein H6732_19920 [Alphaproteobacteria bacterium]|nr:hypothetical protein [Alphaproteobacteria bacterium]
MSAGWVLVAALATAVAADEPEAPESEAAAPETSESEASAPEAMRAKWTSKDGDLSVESWGHVRGLVNIPPDVVVDADGTSTGQDVVFDTRLRAGLALRYTGLTFATEWDFLDGQAAGDAWDLAVPVDERRRDAFLAGTLQGVTPRRASLEAQIGRRFRFEGGLMPANTWGLGLLASGGTREPLFGRLDRGDRMLRLLLSFAPFSHEGQVLPLAVSVGFDRVVEDELARWGDGQEAYHLLTALLWRDPEGRRLGVFYTFLAQTEAGERPRPTNAHVVDLYGEIPVDLGTSGWRLWVGAEGALIAGSTQRLLTYGDLQDTTILSGGAVAEVSIHAPKDLATIHLNAGYGSATGDADAGVLQDFTFDRNYKVGLVLFDEVLGAIDAGTYALLDDRSTSGSTPRGADLLVREGSVGRSAYLQPAVTLQPLGWMRIRVGGLFAWSTGPIANPFYTFRAGGSPRNHLNEPSEGRYLASEIDGQLLLGPGPTTAPWPVRPRVGVEGGVAFLGNDLGGGLAGLARVVVQADW